ncbi:SufB/SufD family protein [Blattabacterium cuenoti]|uniref:SufB/SufD family protein n=1 Tax=Blattabacterium cuenoti TaxID=1653831 RepID=UPI00163D08B3|nr:SufD family Fe-S cluster assembly protein [Blattabacterium cuenoti]
MENQDCLKKQVISSFSAKHYKGEHLFISKLRHQAINTFIKKGFIFDNKYNTLFSIFDKEFNFFAIKKNIELVNPNSNYTILQKIKHFLYCKKSYIIVCINGQYNYIIYPDNVYDNKIIISNIFSQKEKYIKPFYSTLLNVYYNPFSIINTIFSINGVYIYIPDHVILKHPIEILHISTKSYKKTMLYFRNLIIVGKSSYVNIIESCKSLSLEKSSFINNSVTEIYAMHNSKIDYYKVQNDLEDTYFVDNTYIKQYMDSSCSTYTLSLKAKFIKNYLNFFSHGKNTSSYLYGISLLSQQQIIDNETFIQHLFSNSKCLQLYKNILLDQSISIFHGKIFVSKLIQKINAFQKNQNILLSEEAHVISKPQLEIFSNAIRCSHGCTIGNFNKNDIFYLQSRGLNKYNVQILLLISFLDKILQNIKISKIKILIINYIEYKIKNNIYNV